jgi:hypothetical protein
MADAIDYRAVLADLKTKKLALDQAIMAVEAILGEVSTHSLAPGHVSRGKDVQQDSFVGLNILQAAEKYLTITGRPAKTTEQIAGALIQGGLKVTQPSVSTILRKSDKDGEGNVVKVGRALWGLADWYPGRPRRSRQSSEEGE